MAKRKRKRTKSGKGSAFERTVSRELSLWWTHGKRDDIFWRTAGSGGRATARRRKGKTTAGSSGDLKADDPIGAPLTDLIAIELKRGYGHKDVLMSIIDRKEESAQQELEEWFQQAHESSENSGSFAWIVVQRRNQREAVVFMPWELVSVLKGQGCFEGAPRPFLTMSVRLRRKHPITNTRFRVSFHNTRISAMRFSDFLDCVTPEDVKSLVERV